MTLQTATEGPLNPVVKDTEPNPHCLKLDPLSKKANELMHTDVSFAHAECQLKLARR